MSVPNSAASSSRSRLKTSCSPSSSARPLPPEFVALRTAVRDKPDEATRLMKARNRMIDPTEVFNPQNLQRLFAMTR
jgi:hypothetical protein